MRCVVYGEGGFKPGRQNKNVVEEYELPDDEPDPVLAPARDRLEAGGAALTKPEQLALLKRLLG